MRRDQHDGSTERVVPCCTKTETEEDSWLGGSTRRWPCLVCSPSPRRLPPSARGCYGWRTRDGQPRICLFTSGISSVAIQARMDVNLRLRRDLYLLLHQ